MDPTKPKPGEPEAGGAGGAGEDPVALEPDFDAATGDEEDADTWFDADRLARDSTVKLGGEALAKPAYSLADLEVDERRTALDVSSLPGWPDGPPTGHGLGARLGKVIGGLHPGDAILLDATAPGTGRSGLMAQLADGLALHAAESEVGPIPMLMMVTPVGIRERGRWTLARMTGHDANLFSSGARPSGSARADAFAAAREALEGRLANAREFTRIASPQERGEKLLSRVTSALGEWHSALSDQQPSERPLWPIVCIDDLERWPEGNWRDAEVMEAWVSALCARAREDDWILLASARNTRGQLDPWFDVRIEMTMPDAHAHDAPARITATVAHSRRGPCGVGAGLSWQRSCGRFSPLD